MPATNLANTVIVTKNTGSGNFQFLIQSPNGGVRFAFSLLSADMATAAALTSGNSSTFTYAQDSQRVDLPPSYVTETF
jgi:hypothetical protein